MTTVNETKTERYDLHELTPEAQEVARAKWAEGNDYYFLQDYLNTRLQELLEEKGIKYLKYPHKEGLPKVLYSLGYSQGDGACFIGEFEYKSITLYITHNFRYYYSKSTTIEAQETKNLGYHIDESEEVYKEVKEFKQIYEDICKYIEQEGYSFMEYEDSMEAFAEACEANGYTFTKDGVMDNQ